MGRGGVTAGQERPRVAAYSKAGAIVVGRIYERYSAGSRDQHYTWTVTLKRIFCAKDLPGSFSWKCTYWALRPDRSQFIERRATLRAMKSEISPEILRAKGALHDDGSLRAFPAPSCNPT